MKIVRIKQGYTGHGGSQFLENIDFPFVSGPSMGRQGLFIKVDGMGLVGFPQRNFKIFVTGTDDYTIFDAETTKSEVVVDTSKSIEGVIALKSILSGHMPISYPRGGSTNLLTGLGQQLEIPDSDESDEIITERMADRFGVLREISVGAAYGRIRGLVVTGAPGIGKSYEAIESLETAGVKNKMFLDEETSEDTSLIVDQEGNEEEKEEEEENINSTYFLMKGYISPASLYAVLYNNRHENNVTIFDDCDGALGNEDAVEILKSALDTNKRRVIHWSVIERKDGLPTSFEFKGSVIFITNINFQRVVREGRSKITPHLEAILDRCLYLDLMIETMRERLLRIDYVVKKMNMLKDLECTPAESEIILQYIHDNARNFQKLSLRTVLQVAGMYKTSQNWQRLARYTLMKGVR